MTRHLARGLGGVWILVWVPLMLSCTKAPPNDTPPPPRPVKSVVVQTSDGARIYSYSGTAKADVEADISFRVSGSVNARPVHVGDRVKAGQLLASLDTRDFAIGVREAEAQLANTQAALRNARSNYDRVRDLYENDNVARSELDNARAAAESARAQLDIARQNLANQRLQLSYTRLTSPDDCSIAETFVKENENVSSGQTIVTLSCGTCAEVSVSVPETQIGYIQLGHEAMVTLAAVSDQRFLARVSELGTAMSSQRASFPVVVKLKDGCDLIRPGMAADVEFRVASGNGSTLIVPTLAVGEDRDGRFVFVLQAVDDTTWRARRQSVQTGPPQANGIAIVDGLSGGERVVTAGVRRISDGQLVRLFGGGS